MTLNDFFTLFSLFLTPLTIIAAGAVVWQWLPVAIQGYKKHGGHPSERDLLIAGVAIGFIGGFMDNLYWGITWSLDYVSHPTKSWWFEHGVWSNTVFRQGLGITAAWLHLVAASLLVRKIQFRVVETGLLLGAGLVLTLIYLRP